MSNWCHNVIQVDGEKEHLDRFVEKAKGYGVAWKGEQPGAEIYCLDFNQFVPVPHEIRSSDKVLDWLRDNWGTKCCWDVEFTRKSDSSAEYFFNSAWTPPLYVVEAMGKQFPMLRFSFVYWEPLCSFEGEWKCENGVMTGEHRHMPDDWRDSPDEPVASTQVPPIQSLEPSAIQPECREPEIADEDLPF